MKTTTTTIHETSDGKVFRNKQDAVNHEISKLVSEIKDPDTKRTTAGEICRLMADHPQRFIDLLEEFTDDEESDDIAA
jgi:hypothetical protein